MNMFAHPRLITLDVKEPAPSTASAGSGGGGGWAGTGESPWLPGSGQALNGGRFAIRSESGVQVCSVDLTCRESIPGTTNNGPLLASPSGDTFVVGGYGETEQVLFGSAPLREVNRFRPASQSVLPGNDASTLRFEGNSVYVSETGKPERTLALSATAGSYVSPSRFLSDSEIAISESNNTLLVSRLDGSVLYRIAVAPWYQGTSIFPSSGGSDSESERPITRDSIQSCTLRTSMSTGLTISNAFGCSNPQAENSCLKPSAIRAPTITP